MTPPDPPTRARARTALFVVAALAFLLLVAGGLGPVLFPRPCPVTREAVSRVEFGMTREQVYAILGGPPGDHRTLPSEVEPFSAFLVNNCWFGDEAYIGLNFDGPGGTVNLLGRRDLEPKPAGAAEVLRFRLGRAWDRMTGKAPPP